MTYLVNFTATKEQETLDLLLIVHKNYKIDTLSEYNSLENEIKDALYTTADIKINSICGYKENLGEFDEH